MKKNHRIKKWSCILLFLPIFVTNIKAQNTVVRGVVSDMETGRGLYMATVTLKLISEDRTIGTTSDGNGLYQFSQVAAGDYLIMARYVGYEVYKDTLFITGETQNIVKNVRLRSTSEELDELIVSDTHGDKKRAGQISIRPEDFNRAPTPSGSADLVSFIQTQPGVVATGDRGGQLFVRGGTPSENLVLMDGTLIYQPFHIVGFFSVFPEDVISRVDFYSGGFGAKYSGRTSSVMDVSLKNGNLYEQSWSASISPFVSDLFFEAPVKEGKSSVMVSLRGSLIEESSKRYLEEQQPLKFNSQLIKYSSMNGEGLSCSALLLRTYDRGQLDFEQGNFFKWSNFVTGGRCAGVSESSIVSYTEMNFGLSHFSNETGSLESAARRRSSVFRSYADLNITQYLGDWRLDYGFFTSYRTTDYDISDRFASIQENEETFLTTGAFAGLNIPIGNSFSIEPSVSYTTYLNRLRSSFEPRLQISWQPFGRQQEEIHAAAGIYRQPMVGISDYRDAGTAFTTWMLPPDSERRLEAKHALLGWNQTVGRFLDFSIEGYLKEIRNTPVSVWSTIAQFSTDLSYADGTVRGADIRADYNSRNFYLGIGYGFSVTEYQTAQDHFGIWFGEPLQKYHPPHDRRHQVNVQAGFEAGSFTANISWMYGSGMPFTRPMGFDSYFSFEDRPPDVTSEYGVPRVLLEKPFQGKMPDFHRLDVSVEQAVVLSKVKARLQGGAINSYNQENLFYYDIFNQKGINQLPLMPYLSLKIESI